MRDFKGMKRQRGRNRGGGGGSSSGNKQQHNVNRAFDSNGPDGVKIRGNAQHVYEKYQQLARDAGASGDRVLAENYLQHAEHYFRVLRAVQPQRPVAEIVGRDAFASGYDIDFEDESGAQAYLEEAPPAEGGEATDGEQPRGEYRRDDRQGGDRQDGPRQDGPRQDGQREWRDRDRNRQEGRRDDRDFNRDRDRNRDRPRDRNRDERPEREPVAAEAEAVAPAAEPDTVQLRSEDGGFSPAPAFLQPREPRPEPVAVEGEEARPRPRRRRRRAGEDAPAAAEGDEG